MEQRSNGKEKTDPGVSRHGNFMNYYQFHAPEERVRQLPHGVWLTSPPDRKYVALDVGCNAGDLTFAVHDFLANDLSENETTVSMLGVDLDPILIERARERNPQLDRISFECLDFLSLDSDRVIRNYLETHRGAEARFDAVFCFSIAMWIHLNHGDEGLRKFLEKACSLAEIIVIEPQPWKCYRTASRRMRRAKCEDFPLMKSLTRVIDPPQLVKKITESCGFRQVLITEENDWKRRLMIFSRIL